MSMTTEIPIAASPAESQDMCQCLFCPKILSSLNFNLAHMQKAHGLFIPTTIDDGALTLAVDIETLVRYMYLVIFGYQECLFCGTLRANVHAVQQHMMGKGHCRIELQTQGSEWRDFYETAEVEPNEPQEDDGQYSGSEYDHSDDNVGISVAPRSSTVPTVEQDRSLRLSSGRVLAHRNVLSPKNPHRKPLTEKKRGHHTVGFLLEDLIPNSTLSAQDDSPDAEVVAAETEAGISQPSSTPTEGPSTQALTRTYRRHLAANNSTLTVAMSQMSARDRSALSHLSSSERRAAIIGQFKQQNRGNMAERKYWSKYERRQDRPVFLVGNKVNLAGG